jgi:hypothetical protein
MVKECGPIRDWLEVAAEPLGHQWCVGLVCSANAVLKFPAPRRRLAELIDVDRQVPETSVELEELPHKNWCQVR